MSFVDFTEVKARCSIEQAAKILGLKTSEERSQLRAALPGMWQRRPPGHRHYTVKGPLPLLPI